MASAFFVAKANGPMTAAGEAPWRAELDEIGLLLAESGRPAPERLRARVAEIVAEEAGSRLGEALVRRIAERAVGALA